MNKEFVKKMIQAKCLEYEAIKEIMPENIRQRVEEFESNAIETMKEFAIDIFMQISMNDKTVKSETSYNNNSNKAQGTNGDTNKKTSRIAVDFEDVEEKNKESYGEKRKQNEAAKQADLQTNRNVKKKKINEVNKKTVKKVNVDFM